MGARLPNGRRNRGKMEVVIKEVVRKGVVEASECRCLGMRRLAGSGGDGSGLSSYECLSVVGISWMR